MSESVTVVLAEGFDGEDVEVTVDGKGHRLAAVRTSLLTGMAGEVVATSDHDPARVTARLVPPTIPTVPPATDPTTQPEPDRVRATYDVPLGSVLVLGLTDGGIAGRVESGPIGFA